MKKIDLRLFMNAFDFFQNGGAGWKHARRSDGCVKIKKNCDNIYYYKMMVDLNFD
ncbi:MAG: hypothetical protein GYA62_00355 [Bacteroidales bacterium]|nr:hypothetical protein [Bacteroidales bacterium]